MVIYQHYYKIVILALWFQHHGPAQFPKFQNSKIEEAPSFYFLQQFIFPSYLSTNLCQTVLPDQVEFRKIYGIQRANFVGKILVWWNLKYGGISEILEIVQTF